MNNIPQKVTDQQNVARIVKAEEDRYRQELLDQAKEQHISIVHVFDETNPKGGLTIAFRKIKPEHTSTNMVQVAVATCSYADTFSRKIGTTMALYNFFNFNTIDLPLSAGQPVEDLAGRVKRAFTSLWNVASCGD